MLTSLALGVSLCVLPGQSDAATYYTVKQGDSLWKISKAYNTTVDKIKSLNALNSITIRPGQKLLVASGAVSGAKKAPVKQVSRSGDRVDVILDYAKSFIGVPYVAAGQSPKGFDCSGYLKYVFGHFNIDLPRTAAEQYYKGQAVSSSEAKPGDLVAFKTGSYISHIGIYLGNGQFISATSSRGVAIAPVRGAYWGDHFLGFSRLIP